MWLNAGTQLPREPWKTRGGTEKKIGMTKADINAQAKPRHKAVLRNDVKDEYLRNRNDFTHLIWFKNP